MFFPPAARHIEVTGRGKLAKEQEKTTRFLIELSCGSFKHRISSREKHHEKQDDVSFL